MFLADATTIGIVIGLVFLALFVFIILFLAQRYKRCPSNKVLVVYGRVGGSRAAKCRYASTPSESGRRCEIMSCRSAASAAASSSEAGM